MQTITEPVPTQVAQPRTRLTAVLAVSAFIALWVDLCRQLSYTWSSDEQYAYGWFVPLLGLGLLVKKWPTRPAPAPSAAPRFLVWLVAFLALALLPIRLIHEVNPDWPLFSWPFAISVVVISLYAVFLLGGWSWVKHFAFPICFILVAVRWPYRIEHGLTQGLMRTVAALTVEILGWLNIPAFPRGNLIEVSSGVLSVDEACSGIRSLQSTLTAALLLGELYLLRLRWRIVLLAVGMPVAFCFNVVRTLLLTWHAASAGVAGVNAWHDPAGLSILVVSFLVLWAIANWLRPDRKMPVRPLSQAHRPVLPEGFLYAICAWVLFIFVGTEVWFRFHERQRVSGIDWSLNLPVQLDHGRQMPPSEQLIKSVQADSGEAASWQEASGTHWTVFYFRWLPGSMLSRVKARCHRPEVCLPASGRVLSRDAGIRVFQVAGTALSFRTYVFDQQGDPLYVFFCLWEDGGENLPRREKLTIWDRLRAALTAERRLGQRTLEIILSGCANLEDAEHAVKDKLPQLITAARPKPLATINPARLAAISAKAPGAICSLRVPQRFRLNTWCQA